MVTLESSVPECQGITTQMEYTQGTFTKHTYYPSDLYNTENRIYRKLDNHLSNFEL